MPDANIEEAAVQIAASAYGLQVNVVWRYLSLLRSVMK